MTVYDRKGGGIVLNIISKLPEVITVLELAEAFRVSNQTIIREIKRGKLKASKIGRDYRIERGDVVEWVRLKK
jgi:excisionase family DNA binding protein